LKLKERVYEEQLAEAEDKIQTENVVNAQTKEFLLKKINILHEEISKWELKYDTDIGDLDHKIETRTKEREELLVKLQDLRGRRQIELDKEREIREEAELKKRNAIAEKALSKRQNLAAKVIQREMRNYLKRAAEFAAANPKKGGKGGKKGGKKKK